MTWEPPDLGKGRRPHLRRAGRRVRQLRPRPGARRRAHPHLPGRAGPDPGEPRLHHPRRHLGGRAGGIRQFADIGTGAPQWPNAGEAARAVIPSVKVIYVDNDPAVVSHVRVRMVTDDDVIAADLADPAAATGHPAFRGVIDIARPVCTIFGLVPGLMPPGQARQVITGYAGLVAPGSLFVISCVRVDDDALRDQLAEAFTAAKVYNHARGEITGFLDGLEPVDPGLVVARAWRGGMPNPHLSPGHARLRTGRSSASATRQMNAKRDISVTNRQQDQHSRPPARAARAADAGRGFDRTVRERRLGRVRPHRGRSRGVQEHLDWIIAEGKQAQATPRSLLPT